MWESDHQSPRGAAGSGSHQVRPEECRVPGPGRDVYASMVFTA